MTHYRVFLGTTMLFALITSHSIGEERPRPKTGPAVGAMACVDRAIDQFMDKWSLPGGAVAISRGGRLVYARGFGWADVEKRRPVKPDDRFRIASLSKPITATMILKLAESGKLGLDDTVWSHVGHLKPLPENAAVDPRFQQITIRHCLQHSAGFDRAASFDPMFMPEPLMKLTTAPVEPATIVRFMLGRPLDFAPGEKYVYSNFGYCMLGRIIERVTGRAYEDAVRQSVLEPIGARRTRLGKTRFDQRGKNEVQYYPPPGTELCDSIFLEVKDKVSRPYGSFYLEAMDAHGGWVSSTGDLLRLVASLDGTRPPRLLKPESVRRMIEDNICVKVAPHRVSYGCGWGVKPTGPDDKAPALETANWSHTGSLDGTATILARDHRGMAWAALFNSRPDENEFYSELDHTLRNAVEQVKAWPEHDLFAD